MENPCPLCEQPIRVIRIPDHPSVFACDSGHTDAAIRSALVGECDISSQEWDQVANQALRQIDPVAWLKDVIRTAKEIPEETILAAPMKPTPLPIYATGFVGREVGRLLHLRGMTTLNGKASSGKSWFALGAALSSALDGWDVHYLAAEASDVIARRVHSVYGIDPPRTFHLHNFRPGVTTQAILDAIESWVTSDRTLLVIDSISTLMALMKPEGDRWEQQTRLEVFLMGLRELSEGAISLLVIAEQNARGETKGRALDHRSDCSIAFSSVEESDAKEVRVIKAWEGNLGTVGRAMVDAQGPGLRLMDSGPVTVGAQAYVEVE